MLPGARTTTRAALLVGILLSGMGVAAAADLPVKAKPVAYYDWTGFYVGGNVGYGVGRDSSSIASGFANEKFSVQPNGVLGGLQAGYNWQVGSLLLGVETDIQASAQQDNQTCVLSLFCAGAAGTRIEQRYPWFATARGRVGFVFGPVLQYWTGGFAYGRTETSIVDTNGIVVNTNFNQNKSGWTVGSGVEAAVSPDWSVKAEYLYVNLGSFNGQYQFANVTRPFTTEFHNRVFRAGLNYHFNGSGAAPVWPAAANMSGFYVGGNLGYAIARSPSTASIVGFSNEQVDLPSHGWLGGAQAGHNWQRDRWLLGVETDIQLDGQKDDNTCVVGCFAPNVSTAAHIEQKLRWFGTTRARAGYVVGPALLYATGGIAYGKIDNQITETFVPNQSVTSNFSHTKVGWTAGAGIETPLSLLSNWTVKTEYLYIDLGSTSDTTQTLGITMNSSFRDHVFRTGLNYKFNAGSTFAKN